MRYPLLLIAFAAVSLGAVFLQASAQEPPSETMPTAIADSSEVLVGLTGVYILAEEPTPEAAQIQLTKTRLETAVERKLRTANIPILSKEQFKATPGQPVLYVRVHKTGAGFSAFVMLEENVRTTRPGPTMILGATTWVRGSTGASQSAAYIVTQLEKYAVREIC